MLNQPFTSGGSSDVSKHLNDMITENISGLFSQNTSIKESSSNFELREYLTNIKFIGSRFVADSIPISIYLSKNTQCQLDI